MEYDCTISIRFISTEDGGRKTSLNTTEYNAPIVFDGRGYEARIFPLERDLPVRPGETLTAPVKFLNRDSVKRHLQVGEKLEVYEGKAVAHGCITKLGGS